MSCPSELTLSIYADGELATAERRPLEAHLIRCEGCRGRVLALREEAELLGNALLGRERQPARLPARPAAARGLALGAGPALAVAALIAAVVGWILESRLVPSGIGWINPFRLEGVSDMAFDFVFLLRDEAPALLTLGVALAATLSVSAILSFALTAVLRRWAGPGALVLALALLAAPSPSEAHFGLHRHEDYDLPAGETHDGSLILSGGDVNVDGDVDGDLIVASERLAVRGEVRGNVLAFSRRAEIAGRVRGSVFCLCRVTRIGGEVSSDLYALSDELSLQSSGRVARNVTVAGNDAGIEGSIGRDLWILDVDRTEVRGSIARNVDARETRISFRDTARVGGNVTLRLHDEDDLEVDPGAVIAGETRTEVIERVHRRHLDRYREPRFYLLLVIGLAAAFLVGMVLHALFPRIFDERLETSGDFFRALGLGFLALIATPVALVVLALTLAGIPLALIGAAAYLSALYLSGILVAALVGSALVRSDPDHTRSFGLSLLVGILVVGVVAHLPFIAIPAHGLVLLTGLGLIVRRAWNAWGRPRAA